MNIPTEYFKREHIMLRYNGDFGGDTYRAVFNNLSIGGSRPSFSSHEHNSLGMVSDVLYCFEEGKCPATKRLEELLTNVGFRGKAIIRVGAKTIVWSKEFRNQDREIRKEVSV